MLNYFHKYSNSNNVDTNLSPQPATSLKSRDVSPAAYTTDYAYTTTATAKYGSPTTSPNKYGEFGGGANKYDGGNDYMAAYSFESKNEYK